jgi:hypothetical protein
MEWNGGMALGIAFVNSLSLPNGLLGESANSAISREPSVELHPVPSNGRPNALGSAGRDLGVGAWFTALRPAGSRVSGVVFMHDCTASTGPGQFHDVSARDDRFPDFL